MLMRNDRTILVADGIAERADFVRRLLRRMDYRVATAASAEEVLQLMGREMLDAAVVAVEMAMDNEPILARLSRLPALRRLVATGQAGDAQTEILARRSGAHVYLPRPVRMEALAMAIHTPAHRESFARPP